MEAENLEEIQETFEAAANFLRGLAGRLDSTHLLYFYARFKQAREGPCNSPKPGFFDFAGKQKWVAWKELGDMPKIQAMQEYISHLNELESDWMGKEAEGDHGWVSVSTLGRDTDPEIAPESKTIFDWVKESDVPKVKHCLGSVVDCNAKDDSGMGLIHWAADRGSCDIVSALLERGADVNLQDGEQQSALHYACSCGHSEVVQLLLRSKIDVSIRDSDGLLASEVATEESIKQLFNKEI